jgi:hypothetical protein
MAWFTLPAGKQLKMFMFPRQVLLKERFFFGGFLQAVETWTLYQ